MFEIEFAGKQLRPCDIAAPRTVFDLEQEEQVGTMLAKPLPTRPAVNLNARPAHALKATVKKPPKTAPTAIAKSAPPALPVRSPSA